MSIHLIGGGRDVARCAPVVEPFLREVAERAGTRAARVVALLVVEPGDDAMAVRFAALLGEDADLRVIPEGDVFDVAVLDGADGVAVGGGLTPAYAAALEPLAATLRALVDDGMPYLGYSAGAACAARDAILGGHLLDGVPVIAEEAGEDLDEITVAPGLGLVPFSIDVHAAQWGTVPRAVVAVETGATNQAVAIDEYTSLVVDAGGAHRVLGEGRVWDVERTAEGVGIRTAVAGRP